MLWPNARHWAFAPVPMLSILRIRRRSVVMSMRWPRRSATYCGLCGSTQADIRLNLVDPTLRKAAGDGCRHRRLLQSGQCRGATSQGGGRRVFGGADRSGGREGAGPGYTAGCAQSCHRTADARHCQGRGGFGIRSNCVGPGFVIAGMTEEMFGGEGLEDFRRRSANPCRCSNSEGRRMWRTVSPSCCRSARATSPTSPSRWMAGFSPELWPVPYLCHSFG